MNTSKAQREEVADAKHRGRLALEAAVAGAGTAIECKQTWPQLVGRQERHELVPDRFPSTGAMAAKVRESTTLSRAARVACPCERTLRACDKCIAEMGRRADLGESTDLRRPSPSSRMASLAFALTLAAMAKPRPVEREEPEHFDEMTGPME